MRSDENFQNYYHIIDYCKQVTKQIEQPSLFRKRKRPNYSISHYIEGHQSAEGNHPLIVKNHYRSTNYAIVKTRWHD